MMRFAVLLLTLCLWGAAQGQKAVSQDVMKARASGQFFQPTPLLQFQSADVQDRSFNLEGLSQGSILSMDAEALEALVNNKTDYIQLPLPVSDRSEVNLTLVRHEIFSESFAAYASDNPNSPLDYRPGVHYKGIVEGDPTSLVAISVYNDEVMGMISTSQGNMVLGKITGDREGHHVLYNDSDLDRRSDFVCATADDGLPYTDEQLNPQPSNRDVGDCVKLYIEIDDDIVTQKGGATPAINYVTGLFNQSIILYANEDVIVSINEILAWTTNSPYSGSTSSAMLNSFVANTGAFNGNVAQLVSYQASGGIAYLNTLCNSNPDYRKSFASISSSYSNVPTYSWSVMVVTHEVGHVIGSKHTHACAWNGNNTAIDGCAGSVEGNCPLPGIPSEGGTIMSYCHLTGAGINFNLGFGPQPGNVIRNAVNAVNNCLTTCGAPPPPPPPAYCEASGTNSSYEYINKVVLGSINNTSGNNNGYGNYTALSTDLSKGSSYTINLTPGFASNAYNEYWRVWIDYNGDLDWSDAGEQVGQGSGTSAINVTFTVPSGNNSLTTRMRVAMQYNAYPPVCGSFTYGEVEDYTVVIVPASGGATCSDGIQNQGETGIDCGGPCEPCPPPPPPPPGDDILLASYFETGWDSWIDGGSDVARVISSRSYEGQYSIRIADNSGAQSAMTSPSFNVSTGTIGLQFQFYFKAYSMENNEDFWLQYKSGTGAWVTIASYIRGVNFNNNTFYSSTVTVPNFVPTTAASFRIICDASDNADQVFIDQVTITRLTTGGLVEGGFIIEEVDGPVYPEDALVNPEDAKQLMVYPNPASDQLNIDFNGEVTGIRVIAMDGQEMKIQGINNKMVDIGHLVQGIYFLWVESEGEWYPTRFSKL